MQELTRVTLENEMDLILAHKRSMKLAELAGLSMSAQTTFATAVSEVSRNAIEGEQGGCLVLNVEIEDKDRYIVACLKDKDFDHRRFKTGLDYAKRLVDKSTITEKDGETNIELFYYIAPSFTIDLAKVDEWRRIFRNEPAISPYEEIKRKNVQLQDLSEKVQKSEAQYRTLTNSLPMIIFSLDSKGQLLYANEWLTRYSGETLDNLNKSKWKTVVHEADYASFFQLMGNPITNGFKTIKTQARLKNKNGNDYLWHQISISPFTNEQGFLQYWIGFMVDIHAQKVFEETIKDNIELKQTQNQLKENQKILESYIAELNRSNQELQQFAFVASHDLQEPIRKLLYYSDTLLNTYSGSLDQKGTGYLSSIQAAARRMRNLIHDLLSFALINKKEISFENVDLNEVMNEALQDFEMAITEKKAKLNIQPLHTIQADHRMMRQLFENLISNSLKYAKTEEAPVLDIQCERMDNMIQLSFKDNGIGFNDRYLPQMFTLFQRLHDRKSYEGTGLGLAICRKIVELHNGKIWAEGKEGLGARFFINLPVVI